MVTSQLQQAAVGEAVVFTGGDDQVVQQLDAHGLATRLDLLSDLSIIRARPNLT